jgi:hypothetical protein
MFVFDHSVAGFKVTLAKHASTENNMARSVAALYKIKRVMPRKSQQLLNIISQIEKLPSCTACIVCSSSVRFISI